MAVLNRGIAGLSALALLLAQVQPTWAQQRAQPASPPAAADNFSRDDYTNCQTADEMTFRKAIRAITLKALREGTARLDYNAIVDQQWRASGIDAVVDERVDIAIAQVREETAWSELLKSLAYRKQAQELAKAAAERTYHSEAIKSALEELASTVGREIGRTIVLTTADAAEPARRCLRAYLGPRYGMTVARSVNRDASAAFSIDPKSNQAEVTGGRVLLETSSGITGAVLLLVRRQMSRMASRIGQRLVGSVLGRLVSVVAGGVGIVLIAKEFWELRHGILPIIANEMKSAESKAKVREELAKSIRDQIANHLDELSARTADKIVDIWHDFRRAHAQVLQLAEKDPAFKTFLDAARPVQLPRLDEIIAIVLKKDGEEAVQKHLADGSLHIALNKMPESGMQIAREEQSLPIALAWTSLAGDHLDKVAALDIYKRTKPSQLSRAGLARILALDDRLAITRISGVPRAARDVLLELERDQLVNLSRSLSEKELQALSGYLTALGADARLRVLRVIAQTPAKIRSLESPRVRNAILASRDQTAAVGMMLSDSPMLDFVTILRHAQMVWDGRVSPILIWDKHPAVVVAAAFVVLVFLMMLRSLLFGRRRRRTKSVTA